MEREKQLLARARDYMHALSEGRDPLTGRLVEGDSVIDEPRTRRCFAFVAAYLQRELERASNAEEPYLPTDAQMREMCSAEDVPLSDFCALLANRAGELGKTPVSVRTISHFLLRSGLAEGRVESVFVERRVLRATPQAEDMGIYDKPKMSPRTGALTHTLMLTPEAQMWLLRRLPDMICSEEDETAREGET